MLLEIIKINLSSVSPGVKIRVAKSLEQVHDNKINKCTLRRIALTLDCQAKKKKKKERKKIFRYIMQYFATSVDYL